MGDTTQEITDLLGRAYSCAIGCTGAPSCLAMGPEPDVSQVFKRPTTSTISLKMWVKTWVVFIVRILDDEL